MKLAHRVRRKVKRLFGRVDEQALHADGSRRWFEADEIQAISDLFFAEGADENAPGWRHLRHAHLRLPPWFMPGLDPLGHEYAAQQHRLWQLIAGVDRPYDARVDEKEGGWGDIDPVRTPGFFVRRDAGAVSAASNHVLAAGMIMKHSGLKPGQRALEYGAGFGYTALTLARLGVHVDTVDISATFCEFVRRQAGFFEVALESFQGEFGFNPRPGTRYDLVAAALGGHGEFVTRAEDLAPALDRAFASGLPACVNVLIAGEAAPTIRIA